MAKEHKCGPEHDRALFDEIFAVFDKYPEQSKKYYMACIDHETDIMGIDLTRQAALKKIEGSRIITEFVSKDEAAKIRGTVCCGWWNGACFVWWTKP